MVAVPTEAHKNRGRNIKIDTFPTLLLPPPLLAFTVNEERKFNNCILLPNNFLILHLHFFSINVFKS